jgi:hypothetical protein
MTGIDSVNPLACLVTKMCSAPDLFSKILTRWLQRLIAKAFLLYMQELELDLFAICVLLTSQRYSVSIIYSVVGSGERVDRLMIDYRLLSCYHDVESNGTVNAVSRRVNIAY